MLCKIVGGTRVPENEKSRERKFLGTKGPWNESSLEVSFPGNERSEEREFQELSFPGNESSRERKVSGTKVPHRDYLFLGTKGLGHEKSGLLTSDPPACIRGLACIQACNSTSTLRLTDGTLCVFRRDNKHVC